MECAGHTHIKTVTKLLQDRDGHILVFTGWPGSKKCVFSYKFQSDLMPSPHLLPMV